MKCPSCKTPDLVMSERQGVEIDYCPQCRGVWLDRGELDKILERSARESAGAAPSAAPPPGYGQQPYPYQGRKPDDSGVYTAQGGQFPQYPHPHPHYKKKHWLSDLFD
ncbi:MAG TPA: zf-TFIIB domain-containing protein [Phycisphaerales bacterium]|nr:zf-TFIIB domain-containing protein [Phycisphaerales bacterium]